ncbi:MAG: M23 family metallopeptidase [Parvularculaceae bacterium]
MANAPPADRNGRLDLASHISVRGVALSRTPSQACLSSGFGPRRRGRRHEGVALYTGRPAPVAAAAAGEVSFVGRLRGYGLTVDVRHGRGVVTRYAHLSRVGVDPGARLKSGARIGLTGSTGNATAVHLHYEIRVDGRPINPLAGP